MVATAPAKDPYARLGGVLPDVEIAALAPLLEEIEKLKRARNAIVLAHNYMTPDIFHGVADLSGDSLALARLAADTDAEIIVMAGVYLIGQFILTRTRHGRYIYAIGSNEEATALSGVNVKFHKLIVYGFSGMASGIAAIILVARLNSAQPIAGIMYELDAIAAAVIGGTSLMGGEGRLSGTLIGALIMGVLRNGLNLLGVSSFWQQVAIGSVIIIAVLVDTFLKHQKSK
jgi:ribose/xylose/arabinose/galactoside ABC-type transport system permease subunit